MSRTGSNGCWAGARWEKYTAAKSVPTAVMSTNVTWTGTRRFASR